MAQDFLFEVTFMDEASEFLRTLADAPREKIYYNLNKVLGGVKDNDLFKKLDGSDGIWEFRTLYNGLQYRLLAFWDEHEKRLVVATHGFVKKTWKVPAKEIARAEALRKNYYELK
ncbi:MAG: type II toxin-antitoxin system RelE/ParE family toxin [Prevotella sp.]|nr:type II toxin-antitoxin system RelE/ParE family toxin [Prevotella sp.]